MIGLRCFLRKGDGGDREGVPASFGLAVDSASAADGKDRGSIGCSPSPARRNTNTDVHKFCVPRGRLVYHRHTWPVAVDIARQVLQRALGTAVSLYNRPTYNTYRTSVSLKPKARMLTAEIVETYPVMAT